VTMRFYVSSTICPRLGVVLAMARCVGGGAFRLSLTSVTRVIGEPDISYRILGQVPSFRKE